MGSLDTPEPSKNPVSLPVSHKLARDGLKIIRTPEMETKILSQLAAGVSLMKICQDKSMPCRDTVLSWQYSDKLFSAKCARAREAGGVAHAEKLEEINEKLLSGEIEAAVGNVVSGNLKWIAARHASRLYGDKITVAGDEENPLAVKDVTADLLRGLSTAQIEKALADTLNEDSIIDVTPKVNT